MEPSKENRKKNKKFNLKVIKKALKLAIIFFITLLLLSLFFTNYTNKIVGGLVEELINYNTKGKYQISYKSLEYNFFSRVLTLTDLSFEYDSLAALDEEALIANNQNVFKSDIPFLYVDMENIWSIYIKKEMNVKGLRLHDPQIVIKSYSQNNGIEWQNDAGSLYNLISDQLQVFKINNLEVKNGGFLFEKNVGKKRKYAINDVSFKIENFLLDSEADENREKFFYTDDIDIEFVNQEIFLKDSVHSIFFKRLLLSTTESEIFVDSLVLQPRGDLSEDRKSDAFNVYIPEIAIKQINFKSAYNNGLLKMGDLNIDYPDIKIFDRPKTSKKQDTLKSSFSKLALDYFNNIEIDTFNLTNASFSYSFKSQFKTQGFSLDSFNVKLTQFKLDSSQINNAQRPIYYDKIDFSIKDYTYNLPDSIHTLSFSMLTGSTDKRIVQLENLRIEPRTNVDVLKLLSKNKKNKTFNIYVPQASLSRVNGHEFMNTDTLIVEKSVLYSPQINITKYPDIKADHRQAPDINNLYPFVTDFLEAVYLYNVQLQKGHFSLVEKKSKLQPIVTLTDFNIELSNVELDSNAQHKNKLLSAEDLTVNSKKTIVEIPTKNITSSFNEFEYSTVSKNFVINNFQLDRLDHLNDTIFDESIAAKELVLNGLNINGLINKEKQTIDLLVINEPIITYHFNKYEQNKKKDTATEKGFQTPDIEKLLINNGSVDFKIGNHQSVKANNVFLELNELKSDSTNINPLDLIDYDLRANNLLYYDDSTNNTYSVQSVRYNLLDTCLTLRDIQINHQEKGANALKIDMSMPEFALFQWKPSEVFSRKKFVTDKIEFKNPILHITLPKDRDKTSTPKTETKKQLLKFIDASHIEVINGTVTIKKEIENDSLYFRTSDVNLSISDLYIDSARNAKTFLFSDNVVSSMEDVTITFLNSPDSIYIRNIENASKEKSFSLDDIYINKYQENQPDIQNEIRIGKAYFEDFEFDKLKDKDFRVGRLLLYRPNLDLVISSSDKKKSDISEVINLKAFTPDTSRIKEFIMDKIEVRQGKVNLDLPDSIYPRNIAIDDIEMNFSGFDLRRTGQSRIFNSDDINLKFSGFQYHLPDSLNLLAFSEGFFSLADSSFTLRDVLLDPKEEKYEYGHIVGDQTDYLKINMHEFSAIGIDIYDLLVHNKVGVKMVKIDGLDIFSFRDKRIPRITEKEKHLPQKYLLDLKTPVFIDSIKVTDSQVMYEEFGKESLRPGSVDFKKLNATLKNVTNIDKYIQANPHCTLMANSLLMNEGNLDLYVQFNLKEKKYPFYISAKLEPMDLTTFNRMLEPNAFVTIKKGENDLLTMSANANEELAIGEMTFEYDNLKVSLVNKNTFENKGMGPVIGSFFANTFIINKNNPRLLITKEGTIYFERNKYRSIFNYWSKIFFSGVVSSIGAKSNKKEIKKYEKMKGLE